FIKIMISGLMDFDVFGRLTCEPLSAEEIAEMIHIAHEEGFAVMAHANGARTVEAAVKAGIDSIEHGAYMDDEAVSALAESDAAWVPTISTVGNLIGDGRYSAEALRSIYDFQRERIAQFCSLGGRLGLGSDAGAYLVPHVKGIETEYEHLKDIVPDAEKTFTEAEEYIRKRFRRG
ncbi:MAG: Xaa-Pro dipeptidase, partial [Christensenellaceae bacterium]|nr:Xaa-Pro dipeptidase [Christensenellaceae bacterium]